MPVKKEFSDTEKRAFLQTSVLVPSRVSRLPAALQAGISQFEAAESNFVRGKAVGCGFYRNKGPHKGLYRNGPHAQLMGPYSSKPHG